MMTTLTRGARAVTPSQPWYREPWPWFLMAGPAIVVVAGIITYVLAARTENALVVDNYYKEGLAINRVLDATRNAGAQGYRARLAWTPQGGARVSLSAEVALPERLQLIFVHPTHARYDTTVPLIRVAEGEYSAARTQDDAGELQRGSSRWYVRLQDEAGTWRLSGEWDLHREARKVLNTDSR